MANSKLMDYFNKQPRLGCLSTANKEGKVNVAYFGSPRMIDEKTIVMGLGKNRTFAYLQDNPHGVFMIMEPGKTPTEWKGVRLYVKMTECHTSGEKLETFKAQVAKVAGEAAAKIIHAAVTFEVYDIKPLADFGQGWEKSIG
ncbi:MAG: Pyridoxamine 5'-phosphate oxidase [Syntrophorhabdus sp. PtaU1.Bin002]|nr:MAG: Pyridoxamine 5'-phosphate oxidase [Syntrophorhabdus sp. PtaB.Bin006]OPY66420.1 MAG: Pyridoxamine 5'-phosphate oxidase [Syntrophorhabdus sp. PtaU1.Bin050]OPY74010.1 MAG: Pyridoxamine 5'-phosphate oxidase [Syntrophorhabdus sp. PtaU1.Bin002]